MTLFADFHWMVHKVGRIMDIVFQSKQARLWFSVATNTVGKPLRMSQTRKL